MTPIERVIHNHNMLKITNRDLCYLMNCALFDAEIYDCVEDFKDHFKHQIAFMDDEFKQKVEDACHYKVMTTGEAFNMMEKIVRDRSR